MKLVSRGKMMAEAISFLADPRVEVPLLLILAVAFWYGNGAPLEFLGLLLFIDVVLPLMAYGHLLRKKEISDWDITRRAERVPLYAFTTVAHLGGVSVAWLFKQWLLAQILGVFWLLAAVFTLITLKWKISIHMGVNAALVTYLGLGWWGLGLLVLVGWSRWYLKKHRLIQIVGGAMLGGGMMALGLSLI